MTQRSRKTVRKQQRLGVMQTERTVSTVSIFEALLRRWGFLHRDTKLNSHGYFSEAQKIQSDPVVSRITRRLISEGKLTQRSGLFDSVRLTDCTLAAMSEDQLLRLRARIALNDFRLTPADTKEQQE
jgi:hypothetical protein